MERQQTKPLTKRQTMSINSNVRHLTSSVLTMRPYMSFQKNNCGRTSTNGFPHRIRQLTITLPVIPITRKMRLGSFKAVFSANGNQQARSSGFTGNVRFLPSLTGYPLMRFRILAGSGKSTLWFVFFYCYTSFVTNFSSQFHNHPRHRSRV